MPTIYQQRLTIFADDDVTPIVGTVDGGGNVLTPTCSTDPSDAHPYLLRTLDLGETSVDVIECTSVSGLVNVKILDKRTTSTDQTTGWFTALLAVSNNSRLVGRRALHEQQDVSGNWYCLSNGIIGDISLDSDFVTYNLQLHDMREREKNHRIFVGCGTNNSIIPIGLVNGYGKMAGPNGVKYMKPPSGGIKAHYTVIAGMSGLAGYAMFQDPRFTLDFATFTNVHQNACTYSGFGVVDAVHYATRIQVQWRTWGSTGAWTYLPPMPYNPLLSIHSWTALWGEFQGSSPDPTQDWAKNMMLAMTVDPGGSASLPITNTDIELRVISINTVPSNEAPLYIECSFGQLLKDIYDGLYSGGTTPPVLYDATAMAAMVANTPTARLIVTAPEDSGYTWVQDNIYKPLGYLPIMNKNGRIAPQKYALPDPSVSLVQLDDTNIVANGTEWTHSYKNIVTTVVFDYTRDTLVWANANQTGDLINGTKIVKQKVQTIEIYAPAATVLGDQEFKCDAATIRSLFDATSGNFDGNAADDLGLTLSRARAKELFDRFAFGAQLLTINAARIDTNVANLNVGDWVIVASSWMPDYVTGKRGINRIGQIISINEIDPVMRKFKVMDAGPYVSTATQATLGSLAFDATNNVVTVPVTALPAGEDVRVDYAVSSTLPAGSSGLWLFGFRKSATGTYSLPAVPQNSIIWVRSRGEKVNVRPSAWTNAVTITTTVIPYVTGVNIGLIPDGSATTVAFTPNAACLGVRISYAVFGRSATVPTAFTTLGDYASTASPVTLSGVNVPQFSNIIVKIDAYPGWTGSAVSGSVGGTTTTIVQRLDTHLLTPIVGEIISQTSSVATLQLVQSYDPQIRINKYEFRTQSGAGGIFSGWTIVSTPPYSATVSIPTSDVSTIEYRVSYLDMLGNTVVFLQKQVTYTWGKSTNAAIMEFTQTAQTATTVTFTVKITDPATSGLVSATMFVAWAGLTSVLNNQTGLAVAASFFATLGVAYSFTATLNPAFRGGGYIKFHFAGAGYLWDVYGTWFSADADQSANPSIEVTIGNNNSSSDITAKASMIVNAPDNASTIKWIASSNPANVTSSLVNSGGTSVAGGTPFSVADLGLSLNLGDVFYVGVIPYDAFGAQGPYVTGKFTRQSLSASKIQYYAATSFVQSYINPFTTANPNITSYVQNSDEVCVTKLGAAGASSLICTLTPAVPQNTTMTGASIECFANTTFHASCVGTYVGRVGAIGTSLGSGGTFFAFADNNLNAWETQSATFSQSTNGKRIALQALLHCDNTQTTVDLRFRSMSLTYLPADTQATV